MKTNRLRAAQRFRIPAEGDSRLSRSASFHYTGESESRPIEIRDLSRTGVGFSACQPPRLESIVILSIDLLGQTVRFCGSIRWVRQIGNGQWRAGCNIDPPISSEFFTFDANPERQLTDMRFIVHRELHSNDRMPVTISNYSKGGICICATDPITPGENLLFEQVTEDGSSRFVAKVMWERPDLNCYLMGCQFIGPGDAEEFHRVVEPGSVVEPGLESDNVGDLAQTGVANAPPGVWAASSLVYGWSLANLFF